MRNINIYFTSNKAKNILLINLLLVFIFAILYYLQDYIITYYPIFSEKYLLESTNNNDNNVKYVNNNNNTTIKPFIYYIWFSLITQSTIGYTFIIRNDNMQQSFDKIRSIPFKILNISQIISIFIIPALIL